jgi:N-acetylmuramoyl-L-alanine amidase
LKNRAKTWFLTLSALVGGGMALCLGLSAAAAIETVSPRPAVAESIPVASGARMAGDERQTRFILDLDRKVDARAFVLANPYRVVIDLPQIAFNLPEAAGKSGRGLIRSYRFGMVMPGASRLVFDLAGPAKIEKYQVLEPENGQPSRLIVELAAVDKAAFQATPPTTPVPSQPTSQEMQLRSTVVADADPESTGSTVAKPDTRQVIVIDPGHGGIDNGTVAPSGENEKTIVLDFAKALRDQIEKSGKYRVVMTRDDDTFVPLGERVRIGRNHAAALFVSIHADALPKKEGDAQGATIYTLSDKASDAEAEKLAELENKADAIAGLDLTEEPAEVADILIDLTQRETRAFSSRFAKTLVTEMKRVARMHKHPLKSAGFRVLKAHDVPSVLIELGYVSNKGDLQHLVSESWRSRTVGSVAQAIDLFFGKRVVSAGASR